MGSAACGRAGLTLVTRLCAPALLAHDLRVLRVFTFDTAACRTRPRSQPGPVVRLAVLPGRRHTPRKRGSGKFGPDHSREVGLTSSGRKTPMPPTDAVPGTTGRSRSATATSRSCGLLQACRHPPVAWAFVRNLQQTRRGRLLQSHLYTQLDPGGPRRDWGYPPRSKIEIDLESRPSMRPALSALFQPEGVRGAHVRGPPCGDECCRERAGGEDHCGDGNGRGIGSSDAE